MMCSCCLTRWPRHVFSRGIWPLDGSQRVCGANPPWFIENRNLKPFFIEHNSPCDATGLFRLLSIFQFSNPNSLVPGHFLLLSPSSSAAEDSGSCVYHLSSQVLPGSGELCSLQLAVYESGPVVGNLTLLVQHTTSSKPDVSVVIKQLGDRLATSL